MKYLLFFTALITATAADQICQCYTPMFGPPCKEDNTCVIAKGQCYSIHRQIATEKDKPAHAISKGCQEDKDPNVCKEGFVFISTADVFYLMSNVICCKENNCNEAIDAALPLISDVNKTLSDKKLVCPSCFMLGEKTCDTKQMNCTKTQDKCYTISGTITKGEGAAQDFIAKGCATPSTILKNDTTLTFRDVKYNLKSVQVVEAKSGVSHISSCLSFAILLPSVLWFLLDSSLY